MKIMTTFVKFQLCYRFYFLVKTNGKYCVDVFRKKNLKNLQKKEAIPNQNLYILTNIIFTCILSLWEGQDLFGCIGGSIEEFYCVTREREHIDQLLLLRPMYFFLECWLYLWGDSCGIQINSWCQYTQFSSFFGRIFDFGRYMRPVLCVGRYRLE